MAHIDTAAIDRMATEYREHGTRPKLPYMGAGAFRICFGLTENLVVKFDHSYDSYRGCDEEAAVWEAARGTDCESFFAPIVASGRGWVVMEKVEEFWDDRRDLDNIVSKFRALVMSKFGITDLHGGNIGIINDKPVVTDYAKEEAADRIRQARRVIVAVANAMDDDADEDDILDAAEALAIWRRGC